MSQSKDETGIIAETKKALTEDAEVPVDKKAPGSTFSLVALSYMTVLAVGAIIFLAILWTFELWPELGS